MKYTSNIFVVIVHVHGMYIIMASVSLQLLWKQIFLFDFWFDFERFDRFYLVQAC